MTDQDQHDRLLRVVSGGLKHAISAHGPITEERIGSAAKRIVGALFGEEARAANPEAPAPTRRKRPRPADPALRVEKTRPPAMGSAVTMRDAEVSRRIRELRAEPRVYTSLEALQVLLDLQMARRTAAGTSRRYQKFRDMSGRQIRELEAAVLRWKEMVKSLWDEGTAYRKQLGLPVKATASEEDAL